MQAVILCWISVTATVTALPYNPWEHSLTSDPYSFKGVLGQKSQTPGYGGYKNLGLSNHRKSNYDSQLSIEQSNKLYSHLNNQLTNVNNQHAQIQNEVRNALNNENFQPGLDKVVKNISLTDFKGNPSFSIHAEKVYILYPSIFQDPNIYGRLSIPQNINTGQAVEEHSESTAQTNHEPQPTSQPDLRRFGFNAAGNVQYIPTTRNNSTDNSEDDLDDDEEYDEEENDEVKDENDDDEDEDEDEDDDKPKSIANELQGTIVVLNQDIQETNLKKGY